MPPCQGDCPGAIPGSRTRFLHRSRTSGAAESPKLSLPGAAPGRPAILEVRNGECGVGSSSESCELIVGLALRRRNATVQKRGRGRQVMHLPCKQAEAGALPAVLVHFKKLIRN